MNNPERRSDAHISGVPVQAPSAEHEFVSATTLLDLPAALLDDIALRLLRGRETLAHTCFSLFEAGLLHAPSFRLQLDRQCCDQLLSPRVVSALRARECKLAITLEEPRVQGSRLLAEVLGKLGICTAVEACKLGSLQGPSLAPHRPPYKRLDCSRSLAQCLVGSFPALTSLALHGYSIPCSGLASLLSHPQLSLQLQQLDLTGITILQAKRPEPGAATLANLFHASRLKQLSLLINNMDGEGNIHLPNLQPLSQHLTQLCITLPGGVVWRFDEFTAALQPLAQLRVLKISQFGDHLGGLPILLQELPRLHTLQLPDAVVKGQEQLDALLAATQLTSIMLRSLERLTSSRADVPCSCQRLELTGRVDCATAAYLPLHSLTQPLLLDVLEFGDEGMGGGEDADDGDPGLQMAAVHNLTQACKVLVRIKDLWLSLSNARASRQQERLQQLVAVLQALKHCDREMVTVACEAGEASLWTIDNPADTTFASMTVPDLTGLLFPTDLRLARDGSATLAHDPDARLLPYLQCLAPCNPPNCSLPTCLVEPLLPSPLPTLTLAHPAG
ncbi:hypothetical protein V8C86DRAFT_3134393 [Haematococcus lacustris]